MKFRIILSAVIVIAVLTACARGGDQTFWGNSDIHASLADKKMDEVLTAIQDRNSKSLLALFSKNAIENTEEALDVFDGLFTYFQGDFVSYDNWSGPSVEATQEDGQRRTELYATYDIDMKICKYRVAFLYIAEDTENPQNIGIWSMYIINWADDTNTQFAYRGDGKYSPGMHIGVKNLLPVDSMEDHFVPLVEAI